MVTKGFNGNGTVQVQGTCAGWRRWRRLWRGWIVIPTGIGVSVFTVLQWRRINSNSQSTNTNKSFQITCYRAIPLRAMSRAWGWISSQYVPLSFRCWLYTRYANMYGVNLEEAAHSLEHYSSLCEFFIRPLKEGSRPVAKLESIVSPADGSIINAGVVNSCNVEQIKGVTYTIKTFLGDPTWNEGAFVEKRNDSFPIIVPKTLSNDMQQTSRVPTTALHDKTTSTKSSTTYLKYTSADSVLSELEQEGCGLLHLGLDDGYQCTNRISANFKYDSRMLGWLVFYFQFCIKDLLINSFYIGFQIMYGIKSSIILSNGKILRGASFLRSQFSFPNDSSSSSSSPSSPSIFKKQIDTFSRNELVDEADSSDDENTDTTSIYDPDWKTYKKKLLHDRNNELYQFVVYLAPGDYHRFHSPADLKIKFRRHFQGELLSVHPNVAKWIPELFSLNERAVYVGEWQHGFFSLVAVGATNVGSIKVRSDQELLTNTKRWKNGPHFQDKYLETEWKKGEEIGEFRMGSTIVLLFEAPKNFSFSVEPGERIKVGESVTKWQTKSTKISR